MVVLTVHEMAFFPEVRYTLRKWYPEKRGWKIYDQSEWTGIRPHFVVERAYRGGVERSICEVKAVKKVTGDHIMQLNHFANSLSGENALILEKILAVPTGTDTSQVPGDISVMALKHHSRE